MALTSHPNDNTRDTKPMVWIFEGSNVYVFVGGFAASVVTFRLCFDHGMSVMESAITAAVPITAAVCYVVFLKAGKPKSYDGDMLVSLELPGGVPFAAPGWLRTRSHLHMKPAKPPAHPYRGE